jgi:putative colanic acid biosynthesis glycosyltransferase
MTDPYLFSIITVTKNNLAGLKRTHESVKEQSYTNYEWIVIDGLSGDGTRDYLEKSGAAFSSEPDGGIYEAMNKGIERACGEYLLFLNAGDTLPDQDLLSTLQKSCAARPDFIYGDAMETNGLYKKARAHETFLYGMFTHHQAMLYKRSPLGDLLYDTAYRIAADYDFTVRFLKRNPNAHYIPCALCIFEDGGISQKNRKDGRLEQFLIRKSLRLCNPLTNWAIRAAQAAAASLRVKFPKIYFFLRKRQGRNDGRSG